MTNPFDQFDAQTAANPFDQFDAPAPTPEKPVSVPRVLGQFAQGHNDAWANTLGLPVDLVNAGARAIGARTSDAPFLGSQSFKNIFDVVATMPARLRDSIEGKTLDPLTESRTARFDAANSTERLGNTIGSAVGSTASTVLPAGLVSRVAAAGSTPQIVADAMKANPVQQAAYTTAGNVVADQTDSPLAGAATTLALPLLTHGVQRTFSAAPAANTQEAERRALLEFGRQNNLGPLTAGKMTDSGKLQTYEGAINRLPIPFLGGRVKATEEAGRDAWQKALIEKAGITGETGATPQVIENGKADLSSRFNNLTANTTLNVTPKFGMDLAGIKSEYGDRLFEDIQPGLMRRIDELSKGPATLAQSGNPAVTLDGKTYQNIRSDLSRISGTASKPADRLAAGKMVEALDDMAEGSMPKAQMADWRQTRQQWRNLLAIENSVTGSNNAQTAVGNIPVARFGRESQGNPDIERFGQYGNKFVGEKMPYDTASRHASGNIVHMLTGALGAVGGAAGAHGHLPITPYTVGAAGAAAVPFAADLAMNNPFTRALLAARYRYPSNSIVNKGLVGTLAAQEAAQHGQ